MLLACETKSGASTFESPFSWIRVATVAVLPKAHWIPSFPVATAVLIMCVIFAIISTSSSANPLLLLLTVAPECKLTLAAPLDAGLRSGRVKALRPSRSTNSSHHSGGIPSIKRQMRTIAPGVAADSIIAMMESAVNSLSVMWTVSPALMPYASSCLWSSSSSSAMKSACISTRYDGCSALMNALSSDTCDMSGSCPLIGTPPSGTATHSVACGTLAGMTRK